MNAQRTKLIVQLEHVILAVVEDHGGPAEALLAAVRVPRADFARLLAQAGTVQAGQTATFYGDGAGTLPGELPPQPKPQNPTAL